MKKKGNENYSNLGQRISKTNSFRNESNLHSITSIAEQNEKAKYSTDFQILLQHISSRPFSECMQKPEGIINSSSSAAVREQCIVYNQMQSYLQSQQEFESLDQFLSMPSEQQIEEKGSDKKTFRKVRHKRSQSMQKECIEKSPSKISENTAKIKKEIIEKEDIELADEIDALASFIRSKAKRGVVFRAEKKEKIDIDKIGISYRKTIPQNAALTTSTITSIGGGSAAKEASRIAQVQREHRLIQEIQKQQQQSLQNHENSQQNSKFERGKQLRERVNCLMGRISVMSDEAKEYLLEQKIIELNNEKSQSDRKKSQNEEHQGFLQKQNSQLTNSDENMTEYKLSPKKSIKYPEIMDENYLNHEFEKHPKPRGVSLPQIQLIQKHSFRVQRKQSLASPELFSSNLSPLRNNNQLFRFSPKSLSVQTKTPFQLPHNQLISLSPLILTQLDEKYKQTLKQPEITSEQAQIAESNEFTKLEQKEFEKNLNLTPSVKKPKDQRKISLGGHKSLSLQIQHSPTSSSFNSIQSENANKLIQNSHFSNDIQNYSKQLEYSNKQEDKETLLPKVLETVEIQLKPSNDTQQIVISDEQQKNNYDTVINVTNKDNEGSNAPFNKNESSRKISQELLRQSDGKRDSTAIRHSLEKIWKKMKNENTPEHSKKPQQKIKKSNLNSKLGIKDSILEETPQKQEQRALKLDQNNSSNLQFYLKIAQKQKQPQSNSSLLFSP